jgi:hypothetical protein
MKKIVTILVFLVIVVSFSWTQSSGFSTSESKHYKVYSEAGQAHASETALRLEALFDLYNSYFHFSQDVLTAKLQVRIFSNKTGYNDYLTRIISQTREDFIYLHYRDNTKSELIGYITDEESFTMSLNHQSFIQFLRAFVPNPPLWMREGFAVYFEKVQYDKDFNTVTYKENLAWLETIKSFLTGKYDVEAIAGKDLLTMDVENARKKINIFYPQSWALVSFLLQSTEGGYNRIMWDSISALDPEATLQKNVTAVYSNAFAWYDEEALTDAFLSYISSRKSFRDLVQDGIEYYSREMMQEAETSFQTAMKLNEEHYIPYYYMGLISYSRKDYTLADYYYKNSLDLGSDAALTYYAMGVNSYAADKFDDAKSYLEMTKTINPESYSVKADELLRRIDG